MRKHDGVWVVCMVLVLLILGYYTYPAASSSTPIKQPDPLPTPTATVTKEIVVVKEPSTITINIGNGNSFTSNTTIIENSTPRVINSESVAPIRLVSTTPLKDEVVKQVEKVSLPVKRERYPACEDGMKAHQQQIKQWENGGL